ncbi:hypothetical protein PoB_004180400 [Plakobranchus ocellatus]|uniref:Uncharacterized protein n=1 Tax=Plakobranchus ocellatus TaxID=259542 RepID=A0AAV4BA98_9GAST|nr:hypothetical protein PoB_004180400 [Plakobranchus ocellatus]
MPTLSQWKILSRLIVKKNQEARDSDEDGTEDTAQDTDREGAEKQEDIVIQTGKTPQRTFSVQNFNANLNTSPIHQRGVTRRSTEQNLLQEQGMFNRIPNFRPHSGCRIPTRSRCNSEPSGPGLSPRFPPRVRPKSGRTIWIHDNLADARTGDISLGVEQLTSAEVGSDQINEPTASNDACTPNTNSKKSVIFIKEKSNEQDSGETNCSSNLENKEDIFSQQKLQTTADQIASGKTPTRPCLKRSDSCFVRRPDSRTKSVTFDRPFSSMRPSYRDTSPAAVNTEVSPVRDQEAADEILPKTVAPGSGDDFTSVDRSSKERKLSLRPGLQDNMESSEAARMKRPLSSGPAVWRDARAQMVGLVRKVSLVRKASFQFERRASSPVIPGNPGAEKSLPRSPAFPVRRDSILSRNFPGGQVINRPGIPVYSGLPSGFRVSPGPESVGKNKTTALASGDNRENAAYEPYVIKDGHLVKRNLKSPLTDPAKQENLNKKDNKVRWGNKVQDMQNSPAFDTGKYIVIFWQRLATKTNQSEPLMETEQQIPDSKLTRPPLNYNGLSENSKEGDGLAVQSSVANSGISHQSNGDLDSPQNVTIEEEKDHGTIQLEERPMSRSRNSTPTTMVALAFKVMGRSRSRDSLTNGQSGHSVTDGQGAARRWSQLHQAIISVPHETNEETDAVHPGQSSHTNVQLENLDMSDQAELEKLGFRKPSKGKKKKKKKKSESAHQNSAVGDGNQVGRTVINLKEDPVLVKVSKKNQNVGKFTGPPEPKPNAVCFEMHGTSLTHRDVKQQVDKLLANCPEIKLVELQFHHRSLINNIKEMQNRSIRPSLFQSYPIMLHDDLDLVCYIAAGGSSQPTRWRAGTGWLEPPSASLAFKFSSGETRQHLEIRRYRQHGVSAVHTHDQLCQDDGDQARSEQKVTLTRSEKTVTRLGPSKR